MNQISLLILFLMITFVSKAASFASGDSGKVILCVLNKSSEKEYLKSTESIKLDLASNQVLHGISIVKTFPLEKKFIIYNVMTPPMPLTDEQIKEVQTIIIKKYPKIRLQIVEGTEAQELLKP